MIGFFAGIVFGILMGMGIMCAVSLAMINGDIREQERKTREKNQRKTYSDDNQT